MNDVIAPSAANVSPAQLQKIQKAAHNFEAMAIGQLLAPMFDTVDQSKSLFGGGDGEKAWRPMWVSELAKQMEANGGIGLARPIMQAMLQLQENTHAQS
jgi:Rod binding domain-containing protein